MAVFLAAQIQKWPSTSEMQEYLAAAHHVLRAMLSQKDLAEAGTPFILSGMIGIDVFSSTQDPRTVFLVVESVSR